MGVHQLACEAFVERAQEDLGDALVEPRLFGSVARGDASDSLDLDIFAIVRDESDTQLLQDMAFEVEIDTAFRFR